MIKCNVTICGVVSKAATCRNDKDGKPIVTFAVNVVIPAKSGINKTIEVNVCKDGTLNDVTGIELGARIEVAGTLTLKKRGDNLYFNLAATGIRSATLGDACQSKNPDTLATDDSITGQMEFRGKTGKQIEEKTDKKGRPFIAFNAFSAEKVQDGFEYIWVRFIRFDHEREAWLQPSMKISAKGTLELSVYNDRLSISCRFDEISEYIPKPFQPSRPTDTIPF
jgi:hypothetical protein